MQKKIVIHKSNEDHYINQTIYNVLDDEFKIIKNFRW